MRDFTQTAKPLTLSERVVIVDQATLLLENFYAHLPLKRAMYAIDPLQRLRLLKRKLSNIQTDISFHAEVSDIFISLRDLHTNYVLPQPYRDVVAMLPFRVEKFFDSKRVARYIVAGVLDETIHPTFRPGAEILYWNGVPIDRALALGAAGTAGGNADARLARALANLTTKPLALVPPPAEEWVNIVFKTRKKGTEEVCFDWVVTPLPSENTVDPGSRSPKAASIGLDLETDLVRQTYKLIFAPSVLERLQSASEPIHTTEGAEHASMLPEALKARTITTSHGVFGYIRVYSFNVIDADQFVSEFVRLIEALPQHGLIVDVRDNGGGLLQAGEQLLQLFTPKQIEPARFQFLNTQLALRLCELEAKGYDLDSWIPSIERSLETGAVYSAGFPLTSPDRCNAIGQKYFGPVIVVTSARCYSTTDLFAAGFQDHSIGPILGVDDKTGAGGATVWTHDLLRQLFNLNDKKSRTKAVSRFRALPKKSGMRVAIRRSLRVGQQTGVELEDFGVQPDERHFMTKRDILDENADLLERAGKILSKLPAFTFDLTAKIVKKTRLDLTVRCRGVRRVTISDQAGEIDSKAAIDQSITFQLKLRAITGWLEISGHSEEKLVARRKMIIDRSQGSYQVHI